MLTGLFCLYTQLLNGFLSLCLLVSCQLNSKVHMTSYLYIIQAQFIFKRSTLPSHRLLRSYSHTHLIIFESWFLLVKEMFINLWFLRHIIDLGTYGFLTKKMGFIVVNMVGLNVYYISILPMMRSRPFDADGFLPANTLPSSGNYYPSPYFR